MDPEFHRNDSSLLYFLGVSARPSNIDEVPVPSAQLHGVGGLLCDWLSAVRNTYKDSHKNSARTNYLEPKNLFMPAGWSLLPRLKGNAAAKWTKLLILQLSDSRRFHECTLRHSSDKRYPEMIVPHALTWLLVAHGYWPVWTVVARLRCIMEISDACR